MIITTPILIALLVIALFLSILTAIALWLAVIHWQARRYERQWKELARQKEMAAEAAMTALKTYLSDSETNRLAKKDENEQNISNQPGPPQPSGSDIPFFRNRDRLMAAKERLEDAGADHGIHELGTLTPMDAWREVDAALVALDEDSNDG